MDPALIPAVARIAEILLAELLDSNVLVASPHIDRTRQHAAIARAKRKAIKTFKAETADAAEAKMYPAQYKTKKKGTENNA